MQELVEKNAVNSRQDETFEGMSIGNTAAISSNTKGTKRSGSWGSTRGTKRYKSMKKTKSKRSPQTKRSASISNGRCGPISFKPCPFPNI